MGEGRGKKKPNLILTSCQRNSQVKNQVLEGSLSFKSRLKGFEESLKSRFKSTEKRPLGLVHFESKYQAALKSLKVNHETRPSQILALSI